jgi:hypothetical protein
MRHHISAAVAACLLLSSTLAGCAHNPDEIEADYVPPLTYASLSCDDLQGELVRVSGEVTRVTGQQRDKARNDKLAVAGAIIVWPTLFFLDALVVSAKQKKCAFANELHTS